ncbi:MAG: DEAD/DEAH box helicase family protein [Planctomycetota bacterium]
MDVFRRVKRRKESVPTALNSAASKLDELAAGKPKRDPAAREIDRIVGLPLVLPITPEENEEFCRANVLAEAFRAGFRLFPCQSGALLAYDLYDGGFFPIGVGWGKSVLSLMIAERAYRAGIGKSLLLAPSSVYGQLITKELPLSRRRVPISVPFMHLGGSCTKRKRLTFARSGKEGCYILPYGCLSSDDADELLELIQPKLVIADEAHLLKNVHKSARAKRFFGRGRYFDRHSPQLVAMSGTITSKSIADYWHIIKAALGQNCPLPLSGHLVNQWGRVIDATAHEVVADDSGFRTEPVMPLVRWAQKHWPEEDFSNSVRGFRGAFKKRLSHAPGVVATGDADIGTSLVLSNTVAKTEGDGWDDLTRLIHDVQKLWVAPNGDELDHAIHQFGWLYQLSAGFYSDLYWPEADALAEERSISEDHAADLLARAQLHHGLLQDYHKKLRKWLGTKSRPRLDTPFLVGGDMERNGAKNVGEDLHEAWCAAREAEFEGMPSRRSRPVRICGYKIAAAVEWARKEVPPSHGAILWVHHKEIGRWVFEELQRAGLNALACPAGREHDAAITDPANGTRLVVASISAHATGKNLQHFQHQHIVQWPRSAVVAEQMLGRLHRTGQRADELVVSTCNTTDIDQLNFAACLNDAAYIHESTGTRQKMMFAGYDPCPVVYDPAVLRKQGLDPKRLTGEQMRLLEDKFGGLKRS